MALGTLALAQRALPAFQVGPNDVIIADIRTMNGAIRADPPGYSTQPPGTSTVQPMLNQPYVKHGLLFIPNRGVLQLKDGDVIGWDASGWPFVVSNFAAVSGGDWTYVP